MTTARDSYLPLLTWANQVVGSYGLSRQRVATRVITYSGPLGTAGITVASDVITEITPTPKIERLSDEQAAFVMASLPAVVTGRGTLPLWQVRFIPQAYTSGGFTLAQLLTPGTASDRVRVLWMLSGDTGGSLGAYPGTPFEVISHNDAGPFTTSVILRQAEALT